MLSRSGLRSISISQFRRPSRPATSAWRLWGPVPTWPPPPTRPAHRSPYAALPGAVHRSNPPAGAPQTADDTLPPSAARHRRQQRLPCWVFLPRNPTRSDTAAPTPATTTAVAPTAPASPAHPPSTPPQLPACLYPPRTDSTLLHRIP